LENIVCLLKTIFKNTIPKMPIIFNNKFIYQLIIFYIIKSSSKKLSKGSIGSYNNIKDSAFSDKINEI
jgi:hypothetical protein